MNVNYKHYVLFFLIIQIPFYCLSQEIVTINIDKKLNESFKIVCSDFIQDLDYIALETDDNILIDANPEIFVNDKLIIINNLRSCFVFDRFSGKFIREVGRYGKGPDEYRSTTGLINPKTQKIYFRDWNSNLLEYDFNGKYIKSILIPDYDAGFNAPSFPTEYTNLRDQFVCYYANIMGNEEKLLSIFNRDGEKIFTYPNSNIFKNSDFSFSTGEANFYHFKDMLFFKENYCDTIYEIRENELIPSIVLNTGKYKKIYESKWWSAEKRQNSEFITPFDIMESDLFIFFKFYFKDKLKFGIYDKVKKELNICDLDNGINNDLDDFINFSPAFLSDKGEMAGIVNAYVIQQWFKDHPDKVTSFPISLQRLMNINETDNPVIMIAHLKILR